MQQGAPTIRLPPARKPWRLDDAGIWKSAETADAPPCDKEQPDLRVLRKEVERYHAMHEDQMRSDRDKRRKLIQDREEQAADLAQLGGAAKHFVECADMVGRDARPGAISSFVAKWSEYFQKLVNNQERQ
jgi:hypothetical protein